MGESSEQLSGPEHLSDEHVDIHEQRAEYFLDDLLERGFLTGVGNYLTGRFRHQLAQPGCAYLIENGQV